MGGACVGLIVALLASSGPQPGHAAPLPPPPTETYTVAFVEQRALAAGSGPATLALNVRRSAAAAAEAAGQGAQIIVLPEYGLSGFGSGRHVGLFAASRQGLSPPSRRPQPWCCALTT